METIITHELSYSTDKQIPVAIIAKTLLANERLIQEAIRLLPEIFPELQIQKVTVGVREISNASPLKELFALGVFLAYQDKLEEEVPAIVSYLTGEEVPENMETLITVLVILVAIYVIDKTVERFMPGKEVNELKNAYQQKLQEVSSVLGIGSDQLNDVINHRISENKTKSLFKKAYDFIVPAKMEENAQILSKRGVEITNEQLSQIPSDAEFIMEESRNTYELSGAVIELHRSDIDYNEQGWIAVIPEVSDKRKRLILSPDIEPSSLFGKKLIIGEVTVVEEKQLDGDFSVKEYHLSLVDRID